MYDASLQIKKFHDDKVVLPPTERTAMRGRRDTNRVRLKKTLKNSGKPLPIGLHSQGSYAMRTMVQDAANDYDIDDGVYFEKVKLVGPKGGEMGALSVRQMVCEALQSDLFNEPPRVLKNCVRVFYNEGFHVDVPAYRQVDEVDAWTGKVLKKYELASSDWKNSDPRAVTDWFRDQNESLSPDFDESDGQFCRVVRFLKMFSRSRTSWKSSTASGFMIAKLAADCFYASNGRDDISLRETMKAIQSRLSWNKVVSHPVLTNETITNEEDGRPEYFRGKLEENLELLNVLDKFDCSHTDAMKAWGKLFNSDWFDGQPEPEGGEEVSGGFEPTAPVLKKGSDRYA